MTKQLAGSDFVHLHNHTHYSLLDGLQKVPEMLDRIQTLGMESVAVTDHGTISGAFEFYQESKKRGVKPLIGMETYVAARGIADKDPVKDKMRYHLILIAMNNKGYENLMRLSTIANLDGYYYKPRIDHELLEKYNEGLICLSGCIGGELGESFRADQDEKAYDVAKWYKKIFGDRYYIEIQDHGHEEHTKKWDEQVKLNKKLIKLARAMDIPGVITCDAHYSAPDDQEAHEILLCVQTGSFLEEKNRFSLKDFDLFMADPADIIKRWGKDHPDFITNTKAIADRCDVELKFGEYLIPKFPVPNGHTEKTYLDELTFRGLANRYLDEREFDNIDDIKKELPDRVLERAEFELGIIDRMGFNGYFLIVQDFIIWGKNEGIIFGPGRGSGAGSIVAYATRITELDPLQFDLLFERFLNPDRISMPDFDIDIQDSRRDEVIEYCVQKYGKERVANIVTFGKMAARAAVRDVARVLEVPYADADRLAKLIPAPVQGRHVPLAKSITTDPDLKKEYESNPTSKKVIDLAIRLEGTIRSHGVHAAGVVIAPDDIVKFIPLEMAQKGVVSTQYPMGPVEELGLLKMDFLGLSNLTTINNALRIVKKVYGHDIDINKLPLDDKPSYELLARGDTTGVFQLESAGMKRYLKELKPTVFDDIVSMVALYRPGPMQWIDDFIDRKHGRKKIEYLHPAMEPALKSTYGVIVTQEQVMQISKEMCGFTGGQADTLRKGIGKKIPEVLKKMKKEFIDGAINTVGADRDLMEKFWGQLEDFAAYCFNKAHSACYALIAYWTAYLKANYPNAFMAALMTSDHDDTDRLAIEIAECRHMGLKVVNPDINKSYAEFAVVPDTNQISFGLNAVKNVGANAVEEILRARKEGGEFKSIEDYAKRVSSRIVNRKNLESLVKAGAFDAFGERSQLLFNMDNILAYASRVQRDASNGQVDLFGNALDEMIAPLTLEPAPAIISEREMLMWERELLGLYLSSHPLDKYDDYFNEQVVPAAKLTPDMDNKTTTIGGVISDIRAIVTKTGSKMAFVKLEDKSGEIEVIVFPKTFAELGESLTQDEVIKVKGKINAKDRDGRETEVKIIADEITIITQEELDNYESSGKEMKAPKPKKTTEKPVIKTAEQGFTYTPIDESKPKCLYIRIENPDDHDVLINVKKVLNDHPGDRDIILVLGEKKSAMRLPFKVGLDDGVSEALGTIVGADKVVIK